MNMFLLDALIIIIIHTQWVRKHTFITNDDKIHTILPIYTKVKLLLKMHLLGDG